MVNKDRPKKVLLYAGSVVVTIGIVLFISLYRVSNSEHPQTLGVLTHLHALANEEARAVCLAMYTPRSEVKKYRVWKYGSPEGFCTIYCFTFSEELIAQRELNTIVMMIEQGSIPYSHLRKFEYGKKNIYLFLGKGKANYIVGDADVLYWLEVDIPIAQKTVASFIDYLNN